jgi:hypothetical protein
MIVFLIVFLRLFLFMVLGLESSNLMSSSFRKRHELVWPLEVVPEDEEIKFCFETQVILLCLIKLATLD